MGVPILTTEVIAMRFEGNAVSFEFAEVQNLPQKEKLLSLPRLFGKNFYFEIGDRVVIEAVNSHIRVRVFVDDCDDLALSEIVAKCERILQEVGASEQFKNFLTAIEVMEMIEPRIERLVRQIIAAELYPLQQKLEQITKSA